MKKLLLTTIVGLSLGTMTSIYANENNTDTAGTFYISPSIGMFVSTNSAFPTSPAVSLSGGYNFTDMFALQLTGGGFEGGATARADSIWNIPIDSKIMPYFAAGLGYLNLNGSSLAYDFGGGIKYNLTSKFNVAINYRYLQGMTSGMPRGNIIDFGFSVAFGGAEQMNSQQTEKHMHEKYVLPKDVMECSDETPDSVRESTGCYTLKDNVVTMHLDSKFGFNQTALTAGSKAAIDNLYNFLEQYPVTKVVLMGYASSEGTPSYNQELSERRAKAVEEYLASKGVSADRMSTVGYGESDPLASNNTASGREINRRVETSVDVPLAKESVSD